ncbi:hypothetical protein LINGRAHAP2_LOCUS1576 [Linum grandiflorum]
MCTRSWIMDEANLTKGGKDNAGLAVELEGVFSALALEDASVEENIDGEDVNIIGDDDALATTSLID